MSRDEHERVAAEVASTFLGKRKRPRAKPHRCIDCGKVTRHIRCPDCSRRRALVRDLARVDVALDRFDVARQARTIAKRAGLDVERARLLLVTLEREGRARRTSDGLWERVS